jgi:hypothetical protein
MLHTDDALTCLEQIRDRLGPIAGRLLDIEIRMAEAKIDQPHTAMTLRAFTSNLLGQDSLHQSKTSDPDRGLLQGRLANG